MYIFGKTYKVNKWYFSVPLVHVDGGESDDEELVTVVEKEKIDVDRKVVIVTDKFRTVEKVLIPDNLQDFLNQGEIPVLKVLTFLSLPPKNGGNQGGVHRGVNRTVDYNLYTLSINKQQAYML